ncbi:unnamed protein product [Symbiodinium microadriaticum]|nr:unnamed protein product [Symbiodinium microadriaticum]CAE7293609.1 unnamed protein product [Symbiodinium sp. KB8]
MADQVIRPEKLLLPSKRRPRRVKRGYTWLASSYPELVRRNVRAGLHRLKKPHQVARHRGVVCLAGAFAVRKDANEDRVITDPSVNQLLDPAKLPRPRFAYIPKMRTVAVPAGGILVVSKRDARHYFHRLQIGRRWRRWLCGPPIQTTSSTGQDGFRYPASCSAPMGFGPSAGWAQGLTDVIALDAQLPPEQRLHPDTVPPSTMPLWGSIVDDVWAIEHVGSQLDAGVGASWMDAAERAWVARGVEPNSKKSIDNAMGEEIQGYYVDPLEHWVGVSLEKRRWLFQATVWVLRQRRVMVAVVDRLIGKHGFVHSARAIMRSIFAASYSWLDSVRGRRRDLVEIPRKVWVELAISALLLPFCSFNLSAEWSCRVECTDASMSGIGRAWGVVPRNVVQTIARYADHGRVYTNLSLPWSIGLTSEHKCPLRRVRIPVERIKWFTAGAQWMSSHITLGEADAVTWAAADRLRRPADDGNRFVHPLDSAACVGCFTKGRSSSRALNQRCQRMCAIGVAGGHEVFYPWVPSKENPADEPSRRWEPTDEQADEGQPEPSGELLVILGTGCMACIGNGSSRIQAFLLKTLRPSTQTKYRQALEHLNSDLRVAGFQWGSMNEEDQDVFLAEWVIEGFEAGKGRSEYGWALSAVQKVNPRRALIFSRAWAYENVIYFICIFVPVKGLTASVYDIFPLSKPPPFAFLNLYKVKEEDKHQFEQDWKEVAKFNQRQEGYLFTKFLKADPRAEGYENRVYDYIDIVQWTTGDAQRRASLRTVYQELEAKLHAERLPFPMMFSSVVDDTKKTPT